MNKNVFPSISILIPTLNSERVLGLCLESISNQDYPKEKLEVLVVDGGSTDKTLETAGKYGARIYNNPLKTGEAGKAIALKHAQGELVALIDSDNILPDKNWLRRMIEPFLDPEIIGSEPWEFTYRKEDGFIDRYCALLGMNDPLCHFLGNYDRLNTLMGKWTNLPVEQEDRKDWLKVTLRSELIPTIGANGTILRRGILLSHRGSVNIDSYFFDIDIIASLSAEKSVKFAKVKIGIVHLYCGFSLKTFFRKQERRIRDYCYYQAAGLRQYPWGKQNRLGLFKFIFACTTIVPLIYQSLRGYVKKPDPAWFFHPLACWITLWVYSSEGLRGKWSQ
jgi:glycosyltransferase involved in cell wall biosynthesis